MIILMLRSIIIYSLVVFGLRLMGKRQIGELQPSELVITILISNVATMPIEDTEIPMLEGIIPVLTLVTFEVLLSVITLRFKSVRRLVSGSPRILILDGEIDQKEMKNLRFSTDDLMEQLRSKDIFDVRDVAFAIVETTGKVSIYKKFDSRDADAKMLGITSDCDDDMPPLVIVSDGVVIDGSLSICNLDKVWLDKTLKEKHLCVKDIFLMTCDANEDYFIVEKDNVQRS